MTRRLKAMLRGLCLNALVLSTALRFAGAQKSAAQQPLPEAPAAQLIAMAIDEQNSGMASGNQPASESQSNPGESGPPSKLTRAQAEQMAIKNNPRVTVSHLLAMAQHQVVRESRSAELPTGTASLTAVDAQDGSRMSAGYLTASRLFEHAGAGGGFTQLITDFGKTNSLVASAKLREKAQNANAVATEQDITIATDQAFYDALQSQALFQVARQNVDTRQTTESQISELTKNKLKSLLDLSFAEVNLSQAKLLLLDAQNNLDASMATLDAVLGLDHEVKYELVDEDTATSAPPVDVEQLVQTGLQQRPDLQALDFDQQAAAKFSRAERDQMLPTITAAGTVGSVPIRPAQYYTSNWWGGIGVNVNIPVFNGFLYSAEAKEASIRAQAASEQSRDLRDRIVRDIHTAWLSANTAYQRMAVAQQLLNEANMGLQLAQTRYQMGLSSIVELSQAQYQQTDAAIGNTNAEYQYRLALASLNYQIGVTP
jgi:outer membrane protein